jgi:hypothetical protein
MGSELKNVNILKSIVSLSMAEGWYDVMYSEEYHDIRFNL